MANLTFTPNAHGEYVAKYTSEGDAVVQIQLAEQGTITVQGNLTDMKPTTVGVFANHYDTSLLFGIDLPSGVEVTITSTAKVEKAVMEYVA